PFISSVGLRGYLAYKEPETRLAKRQTVRDKKWLYAKEYLASLISSVGLRGYLAYKESETRLAKRQTVRDKG
ncbi:unnamed protein product, partial [Sphenostylis stenocarpa]